MSTPQPAAEWVRIGDLLPWERNPKHHPTENVAEIARSIVRFGFTEPIVPWKSRKQVVAGHGRLLAAQMLYREDPGRKLAPDQPGEAASKPEDGLVPVRWVEFLNDHEAAAYAIADNRLTEKNPMDAALVAEIFVDLDAADVSLDGLGYSGEEVALMLDPPEEPTGSAASDDEAPAVDEAAPPDSQPGQVYELGPHRLVCGDSRDAAVIAALMGTDIAECNVSDPPYGISYKSPAGRGQTARGNYDIIKGDTEKFDPKHLLDSAKTVVLWGANHYADSLPASACWMVWDKREGDAINNNSDCELAWCNTGGSARLFHHKWNGMIKASERDQKRVHPTQKPIALIAWVFDTVNAGNIVADYYAGSGTTLIAAAQTGRVARVIELDPRYCDVIRRRWTRWAKEHGKPVGSGGLE